MSICESRDFSSQAPSQLKVAQDESRARNVERIGRTIDPKQVLRASCLYAGHMICLIWKSIYGMYSITGYELDLRRRS